MIRDYDQEEAGFESSGDVKVHIVVIEMHISTRDKIEKPRRRFDIIYNFFVFSGSRLQQL